MHRFIGTTRDVAAIITVLIASLLIGLITYLHVGKAVPVIHDDYVNLLEADTLTHGRLANPAHPMGDHFETFHVLQQPTYAGKFPLALPIFMAAGQIVWDPLLGVWLSVATGCAAVCWMLLAWFPTRWAFGGGLFVAIMPIVHLWQTSYFGGGAGMLGGALVCGAAIRMQRRPTLTHGVTAAIGAFILFNARPFEGAILCLLIGGALALRAYDHPQWGQVLARRTLSISMATLVALLSFNLMTTTE